MKDREFENTIESQMEKCIDLLMKKTEEYNDNSDRLHNFKASAKLQGVKSIQALSGMMAQHIVSIYDMCGSEALYPMALWEEKITDSINYLLLLKALLIDEGMVSHTEKGETTSACVVDEEVFNDENLKKLYGEQIPIKRVDRSEKSDNNRDSIDALVYGAAFLEYSVEDLL